MFEANMRYLDEAGAIVTPPSPEWVTGNKIFLDLDTMRQGVHGGRHVTARGPDANDQEDRAPPARDFLTNLAISIMSWEDPDTTRHSRGVLAVVNGVGSNSS